MTPTYVVTAAAYTQEEAEVYLGEVQFFNSWKEAREAAFQRFLDNIEIDSNADGHDDDDGPTLGELRRRYPVGKPQDVTLEHANAAGSWVVIVTPIPGTTEDDA